MKQIDHLIVCNPYCKPDQHWRYIREKREFDLVPGRRSAGYLVASNNADGFDDPGHIIEITKVNEIRKHVEEWREQQYPNTTYITKRLLEFWNDKQNREYPFFFCQIEAIETLIWLLEAGGLQTIDITTDGDFRRLCSKMATGTGKTIVMAMVIAWQVINSVTYPHNDRFSKNVLVMTPGLTVKSRLGVLNVDDENNYYEEFGVVPHELYEKLRRANITIHNWHTLAPKEDTARNIVKKGLEGDQEFANRILNHNIENIIVINDEAHHAWRPRDGQKDEDATIWIEGLDRIHRAGKIQTCFDFSATPYIPAGKIDQETLFGWIVSDFSLNDAIESGLVKTPRMPVKDDSNKLDDKYMSRFYHMYNDPEVRPDLNRRAKPAEPLPDLIKNAFYVLGKDYTRTKKAWDECRSPVPPVMITVCNRTETAARVMYTLTEGLNGLDELCEPEFMLHIDSEALKKSESGIQKNREAEKKREMVNTVGQPGKSGGQIRNIVAVQMLTEGWDARTVTQIMGLRAFSSQLLCEQVVGRGLRRRSYEINKETRLFEPEYVNIFGIPFTFLPYEGGTESPVVAKPTTRIEPEPKKEEYCISWPNVDRIDTVLTPRLYIDWDTLETLKIRSDSISVTVTMAPIIEGKPAVNKTSDIDLAGLDKELRMHHMAFVAAKDVYEYITPDWEGNKEFLLLQAVRIIERFIESEKITIEDTNEKLRRDMTILFNLQKVALHVFDHIKSSNSQGTKITLNPKRTRNTNDMRAWNTTKPCVSTTKSHVNHAVYDSRWEAIGGNELERNEKVASWVRNDHLGFEIKYVWKGIIHDYLPDYIVKLNNGVTLVLEMKGRYTEESKIKRRALEEWIVGVNKNGEFGRWASDIAFKPSEVKQIIDGHARG